MTGAMYAAIGGLKSHMSKLNVIGNNVANVNTYGYKAGRMTFKESIYTTSRSGSNGGATAGGNNPSQIGYGCSVGSIDLNMSPSTYAPTGRGLDVYMDGEGFFMFGDKDTNILSNSDLSKLDLSRVGDLWIDPDGYICNHQGKVLYGFARVQNPDYNPNMQKPGANATEEDMKKYTLAMQETIVSSQLVPLRVPLSAAATKENGGIVETTVDGKTVESAQWEEGEAVYPYLSDYEADGKKYQVNNYAGTAGKADEVPKDAAIGTGKTRMIAAVDTDPLSVSGVMHIQLKSVSVEKNGAIQGIAANGDTVVLGYIAVANCDSSDGVTHIDGPYYKAMGGAGKIRVSALNGVLEGKYLSNQVVDTTGQTTVTPDPADSILNDKDIEMINSGLEASSTDIAEEFSQMITTQRGYQANTRIITVTDSMLEELVNMKR